MEKFDFDDPQATAIVNFQLGQLAGLEINKIISERDELLKKISEYLEILGSEAKIKEIVKTELTAIGQKFGDDRKTEISSVAGEVDIEDLIPEEDCVYTLTRMGYIKRQPVSAYTVQNRGGKGIKGMSRREEDIADTMFIASSHDYILFFTNAGKMYRLKGYEIPEGSRNSKGMNIVNILPITTDEKVTAMLKVPDFGEDKYYLCMATKGGVIKRTKLDDYKNIRKSGIIAINLDEGDELRWVRLTDGEQKLMVATRDGMSICFKEDDARCIGRTARGVKAITLNDGDEVVGMIVFSDSGKVLTVSEKGYGRRSDVSNYRVQNRGGKGLTNYHTEQYGKVCAVDMIDESKDIIMISSDGIIIRLDSVQVRECNRPAKGVILMKVKEGEKVVTISIAEKEKDENVETSSEETAE